MSRLAYILFILTLMSYVTKVSSQNHPSLMITKNSVEEIRKNIDQAPLFVTTLNKVIKEVDEELALGVQVPIPKDMAGGYSHERHKRNFFILQKAGYLFQITGEEKYAEYIRDNFMAYAEMFPDLPIHPTDRSYATGKIFWQCLNDANWLVYCSQAYDCVYDWLSLEERTYMESRLFRPLADFLSIENPQFYNRVHNHSTWGNAAVGMIGLVMDDKKLIDRALYGIKDDGLDGSMVDNDGGYIKKEGVKKAGFFAQLDYSFSPDGHFTEGPYYLRYAMTPFLLFSKALSNSRPELNIFSYRDNILEKAIFSLLYETDTQGQFFPINDAQKGMSWLSREVVSAVNIGYTDLGQNPMLLSIAELQGQVQLDETGFKVAVDINAGLSKQFKHRSISYRDGADGSVGGISILRANDRNGEETGILMKYAAQGMGHGHFDRLSYSLFDQSGEVIQDYGSARWVNIDQKGGGRYLPENNTFAKQTVAHNAPVVNETSQYEGSVKVGEENHPDLYFENVTDENLQVVSVKDVHAYPGTEMHRTLFLIKDESIRKPFLIDILKLSSEHAQKYDLPLWYKGQLLQTNFKYLAREQTLEPLGSDHGYQHIWLEANAVLESSTMQMTWFENNNIYTVSSAGESDDEIILGRAGANDPNFNLRRDPVMIHRRINKKETTFANVIESHGTYSPVTEIPLNPFTSFTSVAVLYDDKDYTVVEFKDREKNSWKAFICNTNAVKTKSHTLEIEDEVYIWKGPYKLKKG